MPFISDTEATKIAKRIFSVEEFAHFEYSRQRMRHLDECLEKATPSPYCKLTDPVENLNWCHQGLQIHEATFEHYMQEVIAFALQGDAARATRKKP